MTAFPSDPDDETLRSLVEALTKSGQAISIYDAEDNLRYANDTYRDIFLHGYEGPFTFTEILRHGARSGVGVRVDDGDVEALIARTLPRRRSMARKSFETDFLDGRWFWMDHTILPNGWVLTVGADITALKHNEKSLRQAHEAALLASRTGQLTGLPNRRRILELLGEALDLAQAASTDLCVAVIDLDGFKAVNDTHGHEAGDTVLNHFATVCRARLRRQDRLGRTGGGGFLAVLSHANRKDVRPIVAWGRGGVSAAPVRDGTAGPARAPLRGPPRIMPTHERRYLLASAGRAL